MYLRLKLCDHMIIQIPRFFGAQDSWGSKSYYLPPFVKALFITFKKGKQLSGVKRAY